MSSSPRLLVLQQRVKDFELAVAGFEAMRDRLLERRQSAADSAKLRIDEMIALHGRTLGSLNGALDLARRELHQESGAAEGGSAPPATNSR